jgi:UDP-glucose 4-epimerase
MKVLVTGGAGFIGSHLVEHLLKLGHAVTVLDNFLSGNPDNLETFKRKIRFIRGDLTRPRILQLALKGVEAVVHEAAVVSLDACLRYPSLARFVNVKGTEMLLEESLKAGVRRVVFASSAAVYGKQEHLPIPENAEPRPLSLYAETKLEGERLCMRYFKKGLETVCLRYFNVYGPRQNPEYAGVILKFISCLREGRRPTIYGDGSQTRDFIHVSDVARATVLALEKECAGEILNIGTGIAVSVSELLNILCSLMNRKIRPLHTAARPGEIPHSQADVSKAERVLGFKASISLEEGLRELVSR